MPRKAIGVVRVSQRKGREGERFRSPADQETRIRTACRSEGLKLTRIVQEIDVSGGKPLEKRAGLLEAVEDVEAGRAEVVVVGYFDRLVRSLDVQGQVVSRVEAAGGRVLTVDMGEVSEKTAAQWLSGTLVGAFAEYQRRAGAERSAEAQAAAVARGVVPWNNITPGYRRTEDGHLVPDRNARFIRKAFKMRAEGATIKTVRAYLREKGIKRSFHGVTVLLESRVVLGEIHFGKLVNLEAHKPIVDRELWKRVQRVKVSRGRKPKSDRLLARLGVLRCGTCNSRMVVGTADGKQRKRQYAFYRCPPTGDCPRRVTIGAEIVESAVTEAVKRATANVEGRASVAAHARRVERERARSQADLDAAFRAFTGHEEEPAARERIGELVADRDYWQEQEDRLGGPGAVLTLTGADWDRLLLEGKRSLIRATVERVTVVPGRGPGRITVELFV